jgi:hypothetical protein
MIEVSFRSIRPIATAPDTWAPMLEISLGIPSKIAGGTIVVPKITAMIDTGSDVCRIDDDLTHQYSIPITGRTTSHGMGNPTDVNTYRCSIIFDESFQLQVDFAGYPFQREGNRDVTRRTESVAAPEGLETKPNIEVT